MSWRQTPVAVGDRFIRTGQPHRVMVVVAFDQRAGLPPHARLNVEDSSEELILGLSALTDTTLYRRV
ncbi:hypothetical protein [Azospirillum sp.]|uniref:hypothetical protein n=1 Tax=Azospirillum sp. TaxID=34012 RepID=UPI003D71DA25